MVEPNARCQLPFHIAGKRVGSNHPLLGGVHTVSPLCHSDSAVTPRLNTAGLSLYSLPHVNRYNQYKVPQYCSVWGPSSSGSPSEHEAIVLDLQPSGKCNCEVHDEMVRITMPDPQRMDQDYPQDSLDGTVEYIQRPAQKEAEARTQEVLEKRIQRLMKTGLSCAQIANVWFNASWSRYGQIKKPGGWRNLERELDA